MKLRITDKGEGYTFQPQPDITAFEVAQLLQWLIISTRAMVPGEDRNALFDRHNLWRHFIKET